MKYISHTFFFLILYILCFSNSSPIHSASTTILINEVLYDPIGADLGNEWIELYNLSDSPIDLTGWKIQYAGTTFQTAITLSGTIQPKSFSLVCEMNIGNCDLNVAKLGFQNGGGATDGIQIVDTNNTVVDTIFYDSPNSNGLINELGNIVLDSQTATNATNGSSLGRTNFVDTDNSYNDFSVFIEPTPGKMNAIEESDKEKEMLDKAGSNPLLYIFLFTSFILLIYSARLISQHNFNK